MAYAMKQLACDPGRIQGMSEKLIVSRKAQLSVLPTRYRKSAQRDGQDYSPSSP
jgi:hypothetical protein